MRPITLLLLISCVIFMVSAVSANDDNKIDSLMIENLEVATTGPVQVGIHFFNDEELAALTIPVRLVGGGYTIDSVSFTDSRIDYLKMRPVTIQEDKKSVVFGAICMTEAYIQPGNGLAATLYLSPDGSGAGEPVVVDTVTVGPASLLFTKISSASFVPYFSRGSIRPVDSSKAKTE